jgi:general secretion pathway protein C
MTRLSLASPLRFAPAPAQWVASLVWALLAASAVYWGLKLFSRSEPLPPQVMTVGATQSLQGDPTRLFAAPKSETPVAAAPPASSRFKLFGVVAPTRDHSRAGVATLAVDGGPARVYRVGAVVDGESVLLAISQRGVQIGPRGGPAAIELPLQPMAGPAVGVRPGAAAYGPGGLGGSIGGSIGGAPSTVPYAAPGPDMQPIVQEPMPIGGSLDRSAPGAPLGNALPAESLSFPAAAR